MNGYKTFLSYYSIIVSTVLLVGAAFFIPSPYGWATFILLLPIVIYFWLKTTNPQKTDPSRWSARFIIIVFILSLLGLAAYSLAKLIPQQENQNTQINAEEITKIRQKLEEINGEQGQLAALDTKLDEIIAQLEETPTNTQQETLGTSSSSEDILDILTTLEDTPEDIEPTGKITITSSVFDDVNIYIQPDNLSQKAGKAIYNQNYTYYQAKDSWYKIKLPSGSFGWVEAKYFKQVSED